MRISTLLPALISIVLLVIPRPAHAQAAAVLATRQFDVDGMHSTVGFTARILRFAKVRGRFRQYDVAMTYDSAHLERSSITAIIVTKSIDTDMEFRDKHLVDRRGALLIR
jgi:polyisoprenoid-binding protein YceI